MQKTLIERRRERALQAQLGTNYRERKCRGPLHQKITDFLPEFVDPHEKVANLRRLSIAFDMTYQGVHRWMRPGRENRISPQVAESLVELSGMTDPEKAPKGWRKAELADFWEFVIS